MSKFIKLGLYSTDGYIYIDINSITSIEEEEHYTEITMLNGKCRQVVEKPEEIIERIKAIYGN